MGRTNSTYRDEITRFEQEWQPFRRMLRRRHQPHFDTLVEHARTHAQALEQFNDAVDLVLLDRRMPGMSGDEVLAEIRKCDASTLVVMATAVNPDFDIITMDFDDYLVKPVSRDDLLELVEKMTTLADHNDVIQEYYSLASKKALLEAEKSTSVLETNAEYQQLVERFERLNETIDTTAVDFST